MLLLFTQSWIPWEWKENAQGRFIESPKFRWSYTVYCISNIIRRHTIYVLSLCVCVCVVRDVCVCVFVACAWEIYILNTYLLRACATQDDNDATEMFDPKTWWVCWFQLAAFSSLLSTKRWTKKNNLLKNSHSAFWKSPTIPNWICGKKQITKLGQVVILQSILPIWTTVSG